MAPLVLYDDKCYLCIKFARLVNFLARGKLYLAGHYTELGQKIGRQFLGPNATDMFWFIDSKIAYGGRAALVPLFFSIIFSKRKHTQLTYGESCQTQCKTVKAVFLRSASLLLNSKKIPIAS